MRLQRIQQSHLLKHFSAVFATAAYLDKHSGSELSVETVRSLQVRTVHTALRGIADTPQASKQADVFITSGPAHAPHGSSPPDQNVFLVDICSTQTQSTSGLNESLGCKQAALCGPIQTNTVHYQERRQTTDSQNHVIEDQIKYQNLQHLADFCSLIVYKS